MEKFRPTFWLSNTNLELTWKYIKMKFALGKKLRKISLYTLTIQYEFGTNIEILKWNWNKVEDAKTKFANSKELQRSLFLRFVEKFRVLSINVIHVHVIIGNGIQVNAQPLRGEEGLNDLVASFPRGR